MAPRRPRPGEALLFSTSGGRTWRRQGPNPGAPACPWEFCDRPSSLFAGVGWLRDGTLLAAVTVTGGASKAAQVR
jgi:hypothetical protein